MHPKDSPRIFVPPPLVALATLLMGFAIDGRFHHFPALGIVLVPCLVLAAAGFGLISIGLGIFKRFETAPEPWNPASRLVTSGIYGRTRNPMYLGLLLVYASLAMLFQSPAAGLLIIPLFIIFDRLIVRREEEYLGRQFGQSYEGYRAKVRRWV